MHARPGICWKPDYGLSHNRENLVCKYTNTNTHTKTHIIDLFCDFLHFLLLNLIYVTGTYIGLKHTYALVISTFKSVFTTNLRLQKYLRPEGKNLV